jgi:hypothetical protein
LEFLGDYNLDKAEEKMGYESGQAGVSQLLELEGEDDFACSRAESLKCEPSLLPLSERFLTNRYLSGKMNFCWMSPFGEVAKAGFIVSSSVCGRVSGIEPPTTDIERCYGRDYSQKPLVLPFNIEVMKSPDIVISSLVRFQKFKPLAFGGREPFYELMPFVIPGKGNVLRCRRQESKRCQVELCRGVRQ